MGAEVYQKLTEFDRSSEFGPLDFPIDDFLIAPGFGEVLGEGGEAQGATLAADLGAQGGSQGHEPSGGDLGEVAAGQLLFQASEVGGEAGPALFAGSETALGQGLGFDGPEVLDGELVVAAPGDEGGLGDAELLGDAGEGESLSPQLDELLDGVFIFHACILRPGPRKRPLPGNGK